MLCDCDAAGSDDDVRAEGLCRLLDRAMAEALLTLRVIPVPATPTMLAVTDVSKAVGGLLKHEAGWVLALARGILAQWSSSIEAEAASTEVKGAALDTLLQILCEHEVPTPVTACIRSGPETTVLQADSIKQAAKISAQAEEDLMEPAMKSRSRVSSWRSTDCSAGSAAACTAPSPATTLASFMHATTSALVNPSRWSAVSRHGHAPDSAPKHGGSMLPHNPDSMPCSAVVPGAAARVTEQAAAAACRAQRALLRPAQAPQRGRRRRRFAARREGGRCSRSSGRPVRRRGRTRRWQGRTRR
ncbi:uncharacterized protein [Miscanthus floridulus]|uniref:uncharacterized protein n=1 Tax=Miscanthus floridulus TaxID=154761 RepID=UPI003458BB36